MQRGLPGLIFATREPPQTGAQHTDAREHFRARLELRIWNKYIFQCLLWWALCYMSVDRARVRNCGPWTNLGPAACLLNKVYWRYSHTHLFAYCPWLFAIQQHNGTAIPESLKIYNYLLSRLLPKNLWIPEPEQWLAESQRNCEQPSKKERMTKIGLGHRSRAQEGTSFSTICLYKRKGQWSSTKTQWMTSG